MNKFILIDKKKNQSSFDVIRNLKKEYKHKYFGHTGTLDPLATGLLVVGAGKEALKAIRFINNEDKEYIATIKLGIETDTGDITGNVLKTKKIIIFNKWDEIFKKMIGKHMQKPPIYSAKKINGKRAYKLARTGQEINLEPVEIEIKELQLLDFSKDYVKFRIIVSKGTYIRVVCQEIAQKSQNLGTMMQLRRTKVGNHSIKDIKNNNILDILDVLSFEKFIINKNQYQKIKLGQRFLIEKEGIFSLVYQNQLVSIVEISNQEMKIIRNFNLI